MIEERQDNELPEIKRIQGDDPDISLVKSWVIAGGKPDYKEIGSGGTFSRLYGICAQVCPSKMRCWCGNMKCLEKMK